MLSWMAGPAAAAEAEPAVAESTFIDLGKARWSHRFTTGLNAPVTRLGRVQIPQEPVDLSQTVEADDHQVAISKFFA